MYFDTTKMCMNKRQSQKSVDVDRFQFHAKDFAHYLVILPNWKLLAIMDKGIFFTKISLVVLIEFFRKEKEQEVETN